MPAKTVLDEAISPIVKNRTKIIESLTNYCIAREYHKI